ncbi:MAG: hypothetical protein IT529_05970 [Burkholderiales bacterium]|nr:hypothetical protein [Burkholderiales bacterium]
MCSVHDTVEFEKRGVPAAVVITEAFRKAAEFQFRGRGMPGHGWIELPHPVSSLAPEEVRALAAARVDEVARALTRAVQPR